METRDLYILLGPPIISGLYALFSALNSGPPATASRRAFINTWAYGIALGFGAGLIMDMSKSSMIPASVMAGVIQAVVSFIAGVAVGVVCEILIKVRGSPQEAPVTHVSKALTALDYLGYALLAIFLLSIVLLFII